jgi:hypothetical protein
MTKREREMIETIIAKVPGILNWELGKVTGHRVVWITVDGLKSPIRVLIPTSASSPNCFNSTIQKVKSQIRTVSKLQTSRERCL